MNFQMTLEQLVRPNIWALKPYTCARTEFKGEARVFLDANENPYGTHNRYPDPLQSKVKELIAGMRGVRPAQIMLGNGSDEPIDLVFRIFCTPGKDNVVAIEPTYGMYGVCADVNDVEYRPVALTDDFQLVPERVLEAVDDNTKVIWLCSPNNPTGNLLNRDAIRKILCGFEGIVVIDEAYIDFAGTESWVRELDNYPRLIVLQTFSKAWALAGARCGMAFASEDIIDIFNKVKYPYNVNQFTQDAVEDALYNMALTEDRVGILIDERKWLEQQLGAMEGVRHIFHSDANFLLIRVDDANGLYKALTEVGVIARNRNSVKLCAGCIRITVGTRQENEILIDEMKKLI